MVSTDMNFRLLLTAALVLLFQSPVTFSQGMSQEMGQDGGRPQRSGGHGGPPQEAFDACSGQSEQAQCSVQTPRGDTMKGVCLNPPQQDQLVCVPEDHLRGNNVGGVQQQNESPQSKRYNK